MPSVDMTAGELALATELLESAFRDIKEEVYKTDDFTFKQHLKERERLIQAIIAKLQGTAQTG